MSDAGIDMLSDLPLSANPTASIVATGHTAMHIDTDRRQTLLDKFPATRPTVMTATQPEVATQPLCVVVTRTGRNVTEDTQISTTTVSYVPRRPKRKKKDPGAANKENANPTGLYWQIALLES